MKETIQEVNDRFVKAMIREGFLKDGKYKSVSVTAGTNKILTIKAEWLEDGEINGVFDDEIKLVEGHQIGDVYKFIHSGDICDLIRFDGLESDSRAYFSNGSDCKIRHISQNYILVRQR